MSIYDNGKHKTFISFYHRDDQKYKDYLDTYFSKIMINKSVMNGEYDSENSDDYIKRLIREDKISDSSVVIVLAGKNTKYRKHVDWEIYAGLRCSVNGNSGLVGILLPEIVLPNDKYYPRDIPARLNDNIESGYAKIYTWDYAIRNFAEIIDIAYKDRIYLRNRINNTRLQMERNEN